MKAKAFTILLILASTQVFPIPAVASDWVEDDDVKSFYSRGIKRGDRGAIYSTPQDENAGRQAAPVRRSVVNQPPMDDMEDMDSPSSGIPLGFPNMNGAGRMMVPNAPVPPNAAPPAKKGILGKVKSIGKSIVRFPEDAFFGTEEMLASPGFLQGVGTLAGTGANAYLNYRYMKNNPYSPYWGGLGPTYGPLNPYGSPYSYLNPLTPMPYIYNRYNPYGLPSSNPYGVYNAYGSINPFVSINPLSYGSINPLISPYGGINIGGNSLNPLGLGNSLNPLGMGSNPFGPMINQNGVLSPYGR